MYWRRYDLLNVFYRYKYISIKLCIIKKKKKKKKKKGDFYF